MKKVLLLFLFVAICFTMAGCFGSGTTPSDQAVATPVVDVLDFTYGFIEIHNTADDINSEELRSFSELKVDTEYFLVIKFRLSPRELNQGDLLVDANLTFNDLNILNGRIEEVGTGQYSEMSFTNAVTGNQGKKTVSSFKVPEQKYASKEYKMIIRLMPASVGFSYFSLQFSSANATLRGDMEGVTKGIEVKRVTLEAPSLNFNSSTQDLSWAHVKNANYYKIYVDGAVLKNDEGKEVIVEMDQYATVGNDVFYRQLGDYITGRHMVKIQAFSNSANFVTSSYSNEVDVLI